METLDNIQSVLAIICGVGFTAIITVAGGILLAIIEGIITAKLKGKR